MGAVAEFDRSGVIRMLESRGLAPDAAVGIADALRDYVVPLTDRFATRAGERSARGRLATRLDGFQADLAGLKTDLATLRVELSAFRTETKSDIRSTIAEAKHSLMLWLFPVLFGQAAAIAALVKLF